MAKVKRASKNKKEPILSVPSEITREHCRLAKKRQAGRLDSEGKMRLKWLQDQINSVATNRRKANLPPLPDVETQLEREIPLPRESYPFPWSDEEALPLVPACRTEEHSADQALEKEICSFYKEVGTAAAKTTAQRHR